MHAAKGGRGVEVVKGVELGERVRLVEGEETGPITVESLITTSLYIMTLHNVPNV